LTANGKLDTRALPAPDYTGAGRYRAPATETEHILAAIYADILGLQRVGVDDSFFELGGDSIASMQVVAKARAAGLVCRPRDVFVEQSVARLARVVVAAQAGVVDEGIGTLPATPIMAWLASLDGPTDQFNQTLVLHAPTGATPDDAVTMVGALLDRHAMLRAHLHITPTGAWSLHVPQPGAVPAGPCLQVVDTLSEQALVEARSGLDPAAGVMLRAVWAAASGQLALIIHHLVIDAVSWRVLLGDLNTAWTQHRAGQPVTLAIEGTSFHRWAHLLGEYARRPEVIESADGWKQVASAASVLPAPQPARDTYASAGHLSVTLDPATTAALLGEVPAAFHTGIQDILLIAYAMAVAQFVGNGAAPIGIDVEGHGRHEELDPHLDLSQTVGWFTTKYPVSLTIGAAHHHWAHLAAGDPALGALLKHAKEQLRALPHPLSYGALRYLNPEVDLNQPDPTLGFNYLGRLGAPTGAEHPDLWRLDPHGATVLGAAAAIPMPLGHTLELNAATLDTEVGPQLHANWIWAPTALDATAVGELSHLWSQALTGICAHVAAGGGGLTPSDITPAQLSQAHIDDLCRDYPVADILPLTPLQHGLLFHTHHTHDAYAVQLDLSLSGRLDPERLHHAVQAVLSRHPHLAARFCDRFAEPVQIIPAEPEPGWSYIELDAGNVDVEEHIAQLCARERAAVGDLAHPPAFRVALITTAPHQHRCVLTFHHIVIDGWSLPILLGEIFASYHQQPLPAPVPYRRFICWLTERDQHAAQTAWTQALAGLDTPTLIGPPGRLQPGPRHTHTYRLPEHTTTALHELARAHHTTINTVLQAGYAQLLALLTGRHDIVFGTTVSGRPTDLPGAESLIGLLINTVPVRAQLTATTTTTELLTQLQHTHTHTLDHHHLALTDIHRLTGHDQLFDTLLVFENYPVDTAALTGPDDLTITAYTGRESTHYRLTIQAQPGPQLGLRIEYDTTLFTPTTIDTLITRFQRLLAAMTTTAHQPLAALDLLDQTEYAQLDELSNRAALTRSDVGISIPALFTAQVARTADAVAIRDANLSLTYRELDDTANQLAHLLADHGAAPGQCIALLLPRSAEAITAILAVLKTGAAYLPIDPALPAARIAFMLDDAGPVAAVSTVELRCRLDGFNGTVIEIDDPAVDDQPTTGLPVPAAEDLAHIIYTSGTTGVPKGVAVTHHNVTQLFDALDVGVELTPEQVWTQCHSYAFDASIREIWGALLHGGRLVVVPEDVTRSPQDFHALLVAEHVNVLSQTPSAMGVLSPQGLESTALVVGGEACPASLVDRWAPGRVMVNAYGPTETTVDVSISAPLVAGSGTPPIGAPVAGAALFVLDGWLRPVPVGVVGELYVAG
ncbi:condensation domain-containing protein, partial [Mycobacterium sp. 852002-51971_SCH5477799-a]|uniref:condensation domain-containing protein n=1 Tax=Mycobacterium sp. 852002-51971_SCH5477799-a TaxID=1834106 RepID=UPI0012E90EE1